MSDKITCQICGAQTHLISKHLKDEHPAYTIDMYKDEFPDAPLMSALAKEKLEEIAEKKRKEVAAMPTEETKEGFEIRTLHDTFGLGRVKAALRADGRPIPVECQNEVHEGFEDFIPEKDSGYVFPIDLLKLINVGIRLDKKVYIWGHAGTGKSTILEQYCAHTRRPMLRVQHTVNTEESHIVGQWTVKEGATVFELGPLAIAMKHGLVYMADEYDFALPSVLSVYQAVLEGKPLVIKEADHANRIIKPHPNFRFVATGNTNGVGDETGLYQGTNIQNAANYERFGIVEEVKYMDAKTEIAVIINQSAASDRDTAEKLVAFATEVRKAFAGGSIGSTISPRALINAADMGCVMGDLKRGLQVSFVNRLSRIDQETVSQFAQRVFG
jgi:cobaltochelatase CobS